MTCDKRRGVEEVHSEDLQWNKRVDWLVGSVSGSNNQEVILTADYPLREDLGFLKYANLLTNSESFTLVSEVGPSTEVKKRRKL